MRTRSAGQKSRTSARRRRRVFKNTKKKEEKKLLALVGTARVGEKTQKERFFLLLSLQAASLGEPSASPTYDSVLAVLQSTAKIPAVRRMGDSYYNFWTDASNPRGLWRRTSPSSYRSAAPEWETVLDIDALGKAEGVSWVYKGHALLREFDASGAPLAQPPTRTLLSLSPGGSDAIVRREFDLVSKQFVTDQPFRLDDPSKSNKAA